MTDRWCSSPGMKTLPPKHDRKRIKLGAGMSSFEETLIEVWQQAFAENAKTVVLGTEQFPIVRTSKRKLREVDFLFDGKGIRGLEQNPNTKSRWAAMARDGKKVIQFLVRGRYVACVADGKVTLYGLRK